MQTIIAGSGVAEHMLPEKAAWRGSKSFDHESSHASSQQQFLKLVNNILHIHFFKKSFCQSPTLPHLTNAHNRQLATAH